MNIFKLIAGVLIALVLALGLWLMIFGPPIDDSALRFKMEPYSEEALERAQQDEGLVLINFHRSWCPSCTQQKRILARYFIDFPHSPLRILEVDVNSKPEIAQQYRVSDPTTMMLFRGETRIWFSQDQTRTPSIYSALQEAEYHSRLFAEDDE